MSLVTSVQVSHTFLQRGKKYMKYRKSIFLDYKTCICRYELKKIYVKKLMLNLNNVRNHFQKKNQNKGNFIFRIHVQEM